MLGTYALVFAERARKKTCQCKGIAVRCEICTQMLVNFPLWIIAKRPSSSNVLMLSRTFVAKNFKCALAFVDACGELAEKVGHHPDLHITSYRTVTVDVYTHKVNGLTESDFRLAEKIDEIPVTYSPAWARRSGLA